MVVPRSLRGLTDAGICFIAVQTRHQTSQTAQVVARSDVTRATLPRPSSTRASRALEKMSRAAASRFLQDGPWYGKRCSTFDYISACSTLILALSSLKPSTYTHQLRVGEMWRAESRYGHERRHPVRWSLLVSCVPVGRGSSGLPQERLWGCQGPKI